MTYRLVVKGPFPVAAEQCARFTRVIHAGANGRAESVFVVDADACELARWFGEHTHCQPGALLFYGPVSLGGTAQPFARQRV